VRKRPHPPVVAKEPLQTATTIDDVIAQALSVIRGRVFGRRSIEVALLKQMIINFGWGPCTSPK
jgi:hypothetical protein